jgi:hypothetical protein
MTTYHNLIDVATHSVIVTDVTVFFFFKLNIFTILIFQEEYTNQLTTMLSKYE